MPVTPAFVVSAGADRLHRSAMVIDAHTHPSLKTFLLRKRLWKRHRAGGAWNPLCMRVDLPKLEEGGVDVAVVSHYLPEEGLLRDCAPLRLLVALGPSRWRRLFRDPPFESLGRIIDTFEAAVEDAASRGHRAAVARSFAELELLRAGGRTVFLHAVEGAHSLGGSLDNLARLAGRGVCSLTLAHFYANAAAPPVDGIPRSMKGWGCFRSGKDLESGLTRFGREVVEAMIDLGMIIDLTHCTPTARQEVMDVVGTRSPLVFSHVGVRPLASLAMSPDPREMARVGDSGGVIGVIFMNYWLGEEERGPGLESVVRTVREVVSRAGIEHVALGSDFDGLTDPPDDLADSSHMPRVTDALLRGGFSHDAVERVLGRNVHRVLRDGWR